MWDARAAEKMRKMAATPMTKLKSTPDMPRKASLGDTPQHLARVHHRVKAGLKTLRGKLASGERVWGARGEKGSEKGEVEREGEKGNETGERE
jgi:hypothetical protein